MRCCGQPSAGTLIVRNTTVSDGRTLRVRYAGGRPMTVTGPVTGNRYEFSGRNRVRDVDPRDAAVIVRHSHFRIEADGRNHSTGG